MATQITLPKDAEGKGVPLDTELQLLKIIPYMILDIIQE